MIFSAVVDANDYANGAGRTDATDDYAYTIYAPDTPGHYKTIVYSHGNGGSPSGAADFAAVWNAKGYMVIAPAHIDSPDSEVQTPPTDVEELWAFRVDDCKIALDIALAHETVSGDGVVPSGYTFDNTAPVIAGHSLGGNMAAILAGARVRFQTGGAQDWSDDRFEAAIAISGSGAEGHAVPFDTDAFDTIDIPFLRLSGGYDFSGETLDPGDRLDGVFRNMSDPDIHGVWIETASHRSLTRPYDNFYYLDPHPADSFADSSLATTRFLDAYVDGDPGALAALEGSEIGSGQVGTDAAQAVTLTFNNDLYFARGGDDSIQGAEGEDQLFGMLGADTLSGGPDNDLLNGGEDGDVMGGGAGNDFYVVDDAGDDIVEYGLANGGFDTVFANLNYTLPENVEKLILSNQDAFTGTGNSKGNVLIGSSPANTLYGMAGNDLLEGRAGDDWLLGSDGDDTLWGGSDQDTLSGGDGADLLDGSDGADQLTGGAGDDVFIYDELSYTPSLSSPADDVITDFTRTATTGDLIDVSAMDADISTPVNDAFAFIGDAAFSAAGQVRATTLSVDGGVLHVLLQFNTDSSLLTAELEIEAYCVVPSSQFLQGYLVL